MNGVRVSAWGIGLAACAASMIIGCSGRSPPPSISSDAYTGPDLRLNNSDGRQLVVAHPPSPGYMVRVDRVMDGYGYRSAFLTIRTPNPAFTYPPTPVVQRVTTNVHSTTPLKVFARVEDFKGESPTGEAYSEVNVAMEIVSPPPLESAKPAPGTAPAAEKAAADKTP